MRGHLKPLGAWGAPLASLLRSLSCRHVLTVLPLWLLLAHTAALGASDSFIKKKGSQDQSSQRVWGHIYCDFSLVPNLSISLNGAPLSNITLLPALASNNGPVGSPEKKGLSATAFRPAVEFHLPPLLPGAYLWEVLHPDLVFPKYRILVRSDDDSDSRDKGVHTEVYRLNEYLVPSTINALPMPLKVEPVGVNRYLPVQGGFSIFDLLRQPLVILVLVSLTIMYFLPKMQEAQMEEENRQEVQLNHSTHQDQHVVNSFDTPSSPAESCFIEKLSRQIGS